MADYDLAIIGGGLNGVSVARDAGGRGLRVILLEQGDLGAGASSASPRLIHGDLAVLERRAFLRVRAALAERDAWLRIAPHLVRPMRFAIPAHSDERPPWLLRSGLLLYDRLASRTRLPPSAAVDITHHPLGNALKRPFGTAFAYSDCVVDDSRLVTLHAVDAAERGAVIRTGARCARADRLDIWRLVAIDRGRRRGITARALANARGAWTASVAGTVLRMRREQAVSRLTPFYPMSPRWTAKAPLPGGDFAWQKFDDEVDVARERWRFLTEPEAQRLVAAYGSRLAAVLGDAKDRAELGPAFGPELTGAEGRYLMAKEWARFPDDILWRRSKLGLTMPPRDREALAAFMAASINASQES